MNVMNMNKKVECSNSDLPEELWTIISKKLNTTIDVIRFRSICILWRSLLPRPPTSRNLCITHQTYFLLQTKIYRIESSQHDHNPSTTSWSNKGGIIKVFQDSNSSKLYLIDLFTNKRLRAEKTTKKVLNLMNFRVVELFELYSKGHCKDELDFGCLPRSNYDCNACNVCKVILFPIEGRCMVFALHNDKKLSISNIKEEENIILKDARGENNYFDDIILYKGQLYAVDEMGTIFWINALSLKLVQFSPKNLYDCAEKRHARVNCNINKKQLVEYDGSLYVVHLYVNDERYYKKGYSLEAVFVEVYKLDQEWDKWLEVNNLGDVSFILGIDSNFALLAQDYYECEGNCIYFYFQSKIYCFNLKNLESKPANIFWPYPTLFHRVTN